MQQCEESSLSSFNMIENNVEEVQVQRYPSKYYTNNFYNRPKSTHHTSSSAGNYSRKDFLEQISETTKIFDLKKRPLPGPITQTQDQRQQKHKKNNQNNQMKNITTLTVPPSKISAKQDLFSQGELVLWSSCDWRRREKNFGYFNKLSPIRETGPC